MSILAGFSIFTAFFMIGDMFCFPHHYPGWYAIITAIISFGLAVLMERGETCYCGPEEINYMTGKPHKNS